MKFNNKEIKDIALTNHIKRLFTHMDDNYKLYEKLCNMNIELELEEKEEECIDYNNYTKYAEAIVNNIENLDNFNNKTFLQLTEFYSKYDHLEKKMDPEELKVVTVFESLHGEMTEDNITYALVELDKNGVQVLMSAMNLEYVEGHAEVGYEDRSEEEHNYSDFCQQKLFLICDNYKKALDSQIFSYHDSNGLEQETLDKFYALIPSSGDFKVEEFGEATKGLNDILDVSNLGYQYYNNGLCNDLNLPDYDTYVNNHEELIDEEEDLYEFNIDWDEFVRNEVSVDTNFNVNSKAYDLLHRMAQIIEELYTEHYDPDIYIDDIESLYNDTMTELLIENKHSINSFYEENQWKEALEEYDFDRIVENNFIMFGSGLSAGQKQILDLAQKKEEVIGIADICNLDTKNFNLALEFIYEKDLTLDEELLYDYPQGEEIQQYLAKREFLDETSKCFLDATNSNFKHEYAKFMTSGNSHLIDQCTMQYDQEEDEVKIYDATNGTDLCVFYGFDNYIQELDEIGIEYDEKALENTVQQKMNIMM